MSRPPLPPFTRETAAQKARMAEDAWNSRDPVRVSLAYTEDSRWRNRSEFFRGREAIVEFLTRKWAKEHDYRLIKDLWAFDQSRIAVRLSRFTHAWPPRRCCWTGTCRCTVHWASAQPTATARNSSPNSISS